MIGRTNINIQAFSLVSFNTNGQIVNYSNPDATKNFSNLTKGKIYIFVASNTGFKTYNWSFTGFEIIDGPLNFNWETNIQYQRFILQATDTVGSATRGPVTGNASSAWLI